MSDKMPERWWHGGPRIHSNRILPPSETGVKSTVEYALEVGIDVPAAVAQDGWVYLINSREGAMLYASVHQNGWLYECIPMGDIEDDPDFESFIGVRSIRCRWAYVKRMEKPSKLDVARIRAWLDT